MSECKICSNQDNNLVFAAREMMQGTRIVFDYIECSACSCVQIVDAPKDMTAYYSNASYGSFVSSDKNCLKKQARIIRNKYVILGKGGMLGRLLSQLAPLTTDFCVIKDYATVDSKILDVGCGAGSYINDLSEIGFKNVSGIDPFLEEEIRRANGVVIRKMFLEDVTEKYDVILSHHSFEHVPQPFETLVAMKEKLAPEGVCLLTIPVAEDLYRLYREDCYLIQAPQHFFLYSIKSMKLLAQKAGLKIERIVRDATTTSNWYKYSELWRKNISCNEAGDILDKNFSHRDLVDFQRTERHLNCEGKGDNVTFVLRKAD